MECSVSQTVPSAERWTTLLAGEGVTVSDAIGEPAPVWFVNHGYDLNSFPQTEGPRDAISVWSRPSRTLRSSLGPADTLNPLRS